MKPLRDPSYLRFVRSQPCCVCGSYRRIEAAHTGPRGLGQKSSDDSCIPLCWIHHRAGRDSYHNLGRVRFVEVHQIDIPDVIQQLSTLRQRSRRYAIDQMEMITDRR